MLLTTNLSKQIKLEDALIKANRLCKLYKCDLLDLLVISIDIQAENKKLTNNKK